MSTRCQIAFKDEYEEAWVYRHSDGYPSGVIEDLANLYNALSNSKAWGNRFQASYLAANFIFYCKMMHYFHDKELAEKKGGIFKEIFEYAHYFLGYGVCNKEDWHGDIEYFYKIIPSKNNSWYIKIYTPYMDFWDKPDYNKLKLYWKGTLKQAIKKFLKGDKNNESN